MALWRSDRRGAIHKAMTELEAATVILWRGTAKRLDVERDNSPRAACTGGSHASPRVERLTPRARRSKSCAPSRRSRLRMRWLTAARSEERSGGKEGRMEGAA